MNDVSVRICDVKPGALCTKNHHVSGIVRMAWELRNCGRGEAFDELSFQDDGPLAGAAGVRCVFQVEIGAIDSAEIDPLAATRCSTDRADAMPSYDNAPAPGGAGSTASGSASCAASNTTSNTIMVYFYNRWAELAAQASTSKVARPPTHDVAKAPIKQSDKLQLRGSLAVFDATQGPTGSDTARPGSLPTDHPYCIVVAEDALLPSSLNACAAVEASPESEASSRAASIELVVTCATIGEQSEQVQWNTRRNFSSQSLIRFCDHGPSPEADTNSANGTPQRLEGAGQARGRVLAQQDGQCQRRQGDAGAAGGAGEAGLVSNTASVQRKRRAPEQPSSPGSVASRRRASGYTYTKLKDLQVGKEANLYGIVDHFVSPRRCSGRDLVMNAILIDEGMNTNGIHINIFQRQLDTFPGGGSLQRGDVLRCHRMMIQPYQGRLQALGPSNRRTAYVVFRADRSSSSGFVAKSTTKNFTMESSDTARVRQLIDFACHAMQTQQAHGPPQAQTQGQQDAAPSQSQPHAPRSSLTVAQIEPEMYFDLVGRIVRASKSHVWLCGDDPGDTLAAPSCIGTANAGGGATDPNSGPLSTRMHSRGLVQPVDITQLSATDRAWLAQPYSAGLWVRLNKLHSVLSASGVGDSTVDGSDIGPATSVECRQRHTFELGHAMSKCRAAVDVSCGASSFAEVLPESHAEVARQLRSMAARDEVRRLTRAAPPLVTAAMERRIVAQPTVDVRQVQLSSLAQVRWFPQTPHKFRCRVQVKAVFPCTSNLQQAAFELLDTGIALAQRVGIALVLRLHDTSHAQIDAILCAHDAERFFKKCRIKELPQKLRQGHGAATKFVQRQVARLLEPEAWIECCLASYLVSQNVSDNNANVCFRMFNTHMK